MGLLRRVTRYQLKGDNVLAIWWTPTRGKLRAAARDLAALDATLRQPPMPGDDETVSNERTNVYLDRE